MQLGAFNLLDFETITLLRARRAMSLSINVKNKMISENDEAYQGFTAEKSPSRGPVICGCEQGAFH